MFAYSSKCRLSVISNKFIFSKFLCKNVHSKHKLHNIAHYKVFIDPFENLKDIKELNSHFKMILKIDNKNLPMHIDTLDITSEYNLVEDDKFNIDAFNIFDFNLNEEENSITIEPKPYEYLVELINHTKENKQLHILLKSTNTQHLNIDLSNCNVKIHNSSHFKHETFAMGQHETSQKPQYLNPYFKKLSFNFDNSEVHMEKFDHKFVNNEYSYFFNIQNGSNVHMRKFFVYNMNCEIDSSNLFADKVMGYKINSDPNYSKNSLKIFSSKSEINIKNLVHCGNFEFKSLCEGEIESHPENNNLIINNFSSNSFDINLAKNDSVNLNVQDLIDNSHIKYNYENGKIRIHPFLLMALNIYETFNKKFVSMMAMGRDGYVFCPTIVVDTNEELKKRDITAWEMIKLRQTHFYKIFLLMMIYFVYSVFTVEENVNYKISQFKHYQLFFKKAVEDYLNKLN
jgi:hypothetical protein